jgi:hypothetical protein
MGKAAPRASAYSVAGFPRMCLTSCLPERPTHSPLSEPYVRFSRIRLSTSLSPQACTGSCTRALAQSLQTQYAQMSIQALAFGLLIPPLAAPP